VAPGKFQQEPLDLDTGPGGEPADDTDTLDEVGTKLDLARAYIDMGDPDGARSILDEVLQEGSAAQKGEAKDLLQKLTH
jgi:pilus assembly protein FimV